MATPEEQLRAKLEAAFKETDADKSGSISHAELKNALKKAGFVPTDADVEVTSIYVTLQSHAFSQLEQIPVQIKLFYRIEHTTCRNVFYVKDL